MLHLQVNGERYIFRRIPPTPPPPPPPPPPKKKSNIKRKKGSFLSPEVPSYRADKQKCLNKDKYKQSKYILTKKTQRYLALRSQLAISITHFNTKPIGDFKDLKSNSSPSISTTCLFGY